MLEQHGFDAILVNARDARTVPGQKAGGARRPGSRCGRESARTTPDGCGSCTPAACRAAVCAPRPGSPPCAPACGSASGRPTTPPRLSIGRQRIATRCPERGAQARPALVEMNLQPHHVVPDITGATGMRIIRAIGAGERDPDVPASFRDVRCHSPVETIRAALAGNDRDEHVFALAQSLALYDACRARMADGDARLEAAVAALTVEASGPSLPFRRPGSREGRSMRPNQCAVVRCPGGPPRRPRRGPDADPRPRAVIGAEAGRRSRSPSAAPT